MNIAIVDDEQQENTLLSMIKEYSLIAETEITVSTFHSAEESISDADNLLGDSCAVLHPAVSSLYPVLLHRV